MPRPTTSSHHSGSPDDAWAARVGVASAAPAELAAAVAAWEVAVAPAPGMTSSHPTLRLLQFSSILGFASSSRDVAIPKSCAIRQHTSPAFTTYVVAASTVGVGVGDGVEVGVRSGDGVEVAGASVAVSGGAVAVGVSAGGRAPSWGSHAMAPSTSTAISTTNTLYFTAVALSLSPDPPKERA